MSDQTKGIVTLAVIAVLLIFAFILGALYGDIRSTRECYEQQKERKY
jgi:hypothetical protein